MRCSRDLNCNTMRTKFQESSPPLHSTQRPGDEAVYFPSKVCSWYDPLTSTPYKTGVVDEVNVFTT